MKPLSGTGHLVPACVFLETGSLRLDVDHMQSGSPEQRGTSVLGVQDSESELDLGT